MSSEDRYTKPALTSLYLAGTFLLNTTQIATIDRCIPMLEVALEYGKPCFGNRFIKLSTSRSKALYQLPYQSCHSFLARISLHLTILLFMSRITISYLSIDVSILSKTTYSLPS